MVFFIDKDVEAGQKVRTSANIRGGYNYYQGAKQIATSSKNSSNGFNYYEKAKLVARSTKTSNGYRTNIRFDRDLRSGLGRVVIYGKESLNKVK